MDIFALLQLFGQLLDDLFAHAIQQQIGLRVDQNGRTNRIIPVVVMGETAQRSLQTADNDGGIRVKLAHFAGVISFIFLVYTVTARSGRFPAFPPGE